MTSEPKHIIRTDGTQTWYVNGQRHRTDGPAVVNADGDQEWWVNGQRHRLTGPAVIWTNGKKSWFINDCNITDEVEKWLQQQGVVWPWDRQTQVLFQLTFL